MIPLHELDHPVWHALSGPHRPLGIAQGRAARYRPTVAPFAAIPPEDAPADWGDLASIAGEDQLVLFGLPREVPAGWDVLGVFDVVQMVAPAGFGRERPEVVALGAADSAEMLALVEAARPGPFGPETHLCGSYYGIRDGGRLVAMAGERLTTPSWTEISAVCTAESHRGLGLATALIEHVAHGIRAVGRTPFLHTGAGNTAAIALYERLDFARRDTANVVQRIQVTGVDSEPAPLH